MYHGYHCLPSTSVIWSSIGCYHMRHGLSFVVIRCHWLPQDVSWVSLVVIIWDMDFHWLSSDVIGYHKMYHGYHCLPSSAIIWSFIGCYHMRHGLSFVIIKNVIGDHKMYHGYHWFLSYETWTFICYHQKCHWLPQDVSWVSLLAINICNMEFHCLPSGLLLILNFSKCTFFKQLPHTIY